MLCSSTEEEFPVVSGSPVHRYYPLETGSPGLSYNNFQYFALLSTVDGFCSIDNYKFGHLSLFLTLCQKFNDQMRNVFDVGKVLSWKVVKRVDQGPYLYCFGRGNRSSCSPDKNI